VKHQAAAKQFVISIEEVLLRFWKVLNW